MIYFDTSYLVKCYLSERGSEAVRKLAGEQNSIACCEYGRLELMVSLHRNFRGGLLTRGQHRTVLRQFEADDASGVWLWLGMGPDLLQTAATKVSSLGSSVFVRSGDALHLACAAENGVTEIYSNDRHLLAAAPHFGLQARNVIVQPR